MQLPIVRLAPIVTAHADFFRDLFENRCQFRHFQHYLTGLIVLDNKSLANITRCVIESADKTNLSRLEAEADEMWSFVQKKAHTQWLWVAMEAITRQSIALHVGERSRAGGKALWTNSPQVYRAQATCHTDHYAVYQGVMPAGQHRTMTKNARKTKHSERFNNTLRQRVSRLGRDTLSFSKKLANHIGASTYFICHYKLTKAAALPL